MKICQQRDGCARWLLKLPQVANGTALRLRTIRARAFTLVEVALSLAIVGFGVVAIIGVLPSGIQVQKENREDTIIQQDGLYVLEAIRSGARGIDELTNFVERVLITNWVRGASRPLPTTEYITASGAGSGRRITNSQELVALLTTPKLGVNNRGEVTTNIVVAHARAITGVASEKSVRNVNVKEFAFRYQIRSEVIPFSSLPEQFLASTNSLLRGEQARQFDLRRNLYEVRLTVAWPLFQQGGRLVIGSNRRTFRTMVSGAVDPRDALLAPNHYTTRF
ncbi:MAG: type II secretion system protein [Pedosphaera sp.]|nr:type II secretion system protein [Pedosphaera sp.]